MRAPEHGRYEAQYLCPANLLAPHDVERSVLEIRLGRQPETGSVSRPKRHRDEDGLGRYLLTAELYMRLVTLETPQQPADRPKVPAEAPEIRRRLRDPSGDFGVEPDPEP